MRLGIFAKTFPHIGADQVMAAAAAAGFDCVQYNMSCSGLEPMPDELPVEVAQNVASAALASGVEIVALSGTFNMIHPDLATRERGQSRLRVLASRCTDLTAGLITLCTGTRDPHDQWTRHPANDDPEAWRDLLHEMERAVKTAEEFGIDLGIEPELANVVGSCAKARRLLDEIRSSRLKIIFDPANLFEVATLSEQRRLVSEGLDLLAEDLVLVHAKDRNAEGVVTAAGKGVLDYPHLLHELQRSGFTGPLVAHGLQASEAPDVAAFLRRQLAQR